MSTAELVEALRRLSPEELREVRRVLDELQADLDVHEQMVREGLVTRGSRRIPSHTPLALDLDPPVSQTIIEERR